MQPWGTPWHTPGVVATVESWGENRNREGSLEEDFLGEDFSAKFDHISVPVFFFPLCLNMAFSLGIPSFWMIKTSTFLTALCGLNCKTSFGNRNLSWASPSFVRCPRNISPFQCNIGQSVLRKTRFVVKHQVEIIRSTTLWFNMETEHWWFLFVFAISLKRNFQVLLSPSELYLDLGVSLPGICGIL